MNNKIGFLIEDGVFEEQQEIIDCLTSKNISHIIVTEAWKNGFFNKDVLEVRKDLDKIFCYGSIDFIKCIQDYRIIPRFKTQFDPNWYDCDTYYPYFNQFLFNKDYKIVTMRDIWNNLDLIENKFVKPCRGDKICGAYGRVVTDQKIVGGCGKYSWKEASKIFDRPDDLFLIAPMRNIDYEWRTIIKNRECLTGSQYMSFDKTTNKLGVDISSNLPNDVAEYANMVANETAYGDGFYVLDIVGSEEELFVMEINALSTSGWYDCNKEIIIEAILESIK
jgi:hypothetical protein